MGTLVIVGGCNELGRVVIRASEHESIVVTSRDEVRAKVFAEELGDERVSGCRLDLGEDTHISSFFEKYSRLSALVCLAVARQPVRDDLEYTREEWLEEMSINIGATYKCAVEASKLMSDGGPIVLTGSVYGQVAVDHRIYPAGMAHTPITYAVSKAATAHLARELAVILAAKNIRVNCLSFGGVANAQPREFVERYSYKVPLGRMAQYSELESACRFLLSGDNTYYTGQELMLDGGFSAL